MYAEPTHLQGEWPKHTHKKWVALPCLTYAQSGHKTDAQFALFELGKILSRRVSERPDRNQMLLYSVIRPWFFFYHYRTARAGQATGIGAGCTTFKAPVHSTAVLHFLETLVSVYDVVADTESHDDLQVAARVAVRRKDRVLRHLELGCFDEFGRRRGPFSFFLFGQRNGVCAIGGLDADHHGPALLGLVFGVCDLVMGRRG